jgi:predicted nucleic acid-binding protein
MSDFFDTSVLIGAVTEDDIEHEACFRVWRLAEKPILYAHAILESFSTLTGGRHPARLSPAEASGLLSENLRTKQASIIQFSPQEILSLVQKARSRGVSGGAVYDYMHLCAARKSKADRVYTLNKRHFVAIAPDLADRIVTP